MTDVGSPAKSELDRLVQRAIDRLTSARYTFTEEEALHGVWQAGYEVTADSDSRFVLAQEAHGQYPRQWRLATHMLANSRLLDVLRSGAWDGRDVELELHHLDSEDGVHYVFCPTDDRFRGLPDGSWEPTEEVEVALPPEVEARLDALGPALLQVWKESDGSPWSVLRVVEVLSEVGWPEAAEESNWLFVRSWLRHFPSVLRVGVDYWVPADRVPDIPARQVLSVAPVRHTEHETAHRAVVVGDRPPVAGSGREQQDGGHLIPTAPSTSVSPAGWTATLRTVNVIGGFLPVPAHARGSYPARPEGAGPVEVLRGKWFDTGDDLWLWLDRAEDRLYGPDLADKLAWCSTGERVRIDWAADVIVLRTVGIDLEVQEEEARLVDGEALKELRGGVGETYRQSLAAILNGAPNGLTFPEVVSALRERQGHAVHRGTIRALLAAGGFAQRNGWWLVDLDPSEGARHLRRVMAQAYVPTDEPQGLDAVLRGIRERLHQIVAELRGDASREG